MSTEIQPGGQKPEVVRLQLTRDDMLQVWRDAIVGHQTALHSRQSWQYARIVSACDKILYPKQRRNKQAKGKDKR